MGNDNGRKLRIIVADDEEDVLILIERVLAREGFEVQISPNAENIMDLISNNPPDMILLDIRMDGVDGGEICKKLKKNEATSQIPVVLFSANHDIERIALDCGADDCMVKPFNAVVARETFRKVLAR
jgi:DNA-binding response OmpR family regulator